MEKIAKKSLIQRKQLLSKCYIKEKCNIYVFQNRNVDKSRHFLMFMVIILFEKNLEKEIL